MIKKIILSLIPINSLVILGMLVTPEFHAQLQISNELDSLISVAKSAPDDTMKVDLLQSIAQGYWGIDPSASLPFIEEARVISEKIGFEKGIRDSYGIMGATYMQMADFERATEMLEKSKELCEKANDYASLMRVDGTLGNIAYSKGNYPVAIDYMIQALKAAEQLNDQMAIAISLNNIGSIYKEQDKLSEAKPYYEKALKINEKNGFDRFVIINLENLASIASQEKNFSEAQRFAERGLAIAQNIGDPNDLANAYGLMGNTLLSLNQPSSALDYIFKQLQTAKQSSNQGSMSDAYSNIARIYHESTITQNDSILLNTFHGNKQLAIVSARLYNDSAIVITERIGDIGKLVKLYKNQSDILNSLGDVEGAFAAFKTYTSLKDSVFNLEKDKKITQTTMQYEFDKKEAAMIAEQDKKAIRERLIRNGITAGLAGALIFLIVVFRQRNKISKEKKRSEELLLNILPEEVAEELKQKGEAEAVLIDEVTVLFTDFKGFTAMSEILSPKELVRDLHECFSVFDKIMEKYGLEKIKTIGDAYMAAGGLPTPNKTHALDAIKAALEMKNFIAEGKLKKISLNAPYFEIRIGVHTGPVVAGIVGVKKFQYDIWGDTVNTASRMESSGEVGKVNISQTTYELVKHEYQCTARGKIAAKGKGDLEMYFVEDPI